MTAALSNTLRQRKDAASGYAQFKGKYISAQDLTNLFPFLDQVCIDLSQEVLYVAPWGAALRTQLGAAVSILDMISDITVIIDKWINKDYWDAWFLICIIGIAIFLQLVVVYFQYRRLGFKRVAWESFLVISCVKPGVDAWR